jgi:hypothetical protein
MQKFELYDLNRFEFPGVEKVTLEILKQKFEEYNWDKIADQWKISLKKGESDL